MLLVDGKIRYRSSISDHKNYGLVNCDQYFVAMFNCICTAHEYFITDQREVYYRSNENQRLPPKKISIIINEEPENNIEIKHLAPGKWLYLLTMKGELLYLNHYELDIDKYDINGCPRSLGTKMQSEKVRVPNKLIAIYNIGIYGIICITTERKALIIYNNAEADCIKTMNNQIINEEIVDVAESHNSCILVTVNKKAYIVCSDGDTKYYSQLIESDADAVSGCDSRYFGCFYVYRENNILSTFYINYDDADNLEFQSTGMRREHNVYIMGLGLKNTLTTTHYTVRSFTIIEKKLYEFDIPMTVDDLIRPNLHPLCLNFDVKSILKETFDGVYILSETDELYLLLIRSQKTQVFKILEGHSNFSFLNETPQLFSSTIKRSTH